MYRNIVRPAFTVLLGFVLLPIFAESVFCQTESPFSTVRRMLISDGFDKDALAALYDSPEVSMDFRVVRFFFVIRESKVNYGQFLEPDQIYHAQKYLQKHRESFNAAEQIYGVDRTVIAAILLVETKLGSYLGKYPVFKSLSSIASLVSPAVRETIWNQIADSGNYTRERFDARADQKAAWAYGELKAFMAYAEREQKNPLKLFGSYAGALGICQFLPSNLLTLAVDGNSDGHVNVFDHADAIASVANYLKHHGWKPGISEQNASQVIFRYNNSTYYVNAVLSISTMLQR